MNFGKLAIAVGLIVFFSPEAQAHSGGTDAAGCHTDNSNGSYHCHNGGGGGGASGGDPTVVLAVLGGIVLVVLVVLFVAAVVAVTMALLERPKGKSWVNYDYVLTQRRRYLAWLVPLEE